jgi:integrase
MDEAKWRVESLVTADSSQASPVAGTWYNKGGSLVVPIGRWRVEYAAELEVTRAAAVTPHLLWHSFSQWSLDAGIDISYLRQQLGHSSLATTAIYLQARPNHRRKAYESALFERLLYPG